MAVAGYAIGAEEGILYLRAEYAYLKPRLEKILADLRRKHLLGRAVAGEKGFTFDITIKMGAGAYVCGEESALLESAEGKRGEPRDRPPFPVTYGYLGLPTTVNNVETLCAAARILEKDASWFRSLGHGEVGRDQAPERLRRLRPARGLRGRFRDCGPSSPGNGRRARRPGRPGRRPLRACIARGQFDRRIGFEDLPTGGSIIVIGPERDLLEIVHNFMDFFIEESCGWCTPCRAGNSLLRQKLDKIMSGQGDAPGTSTRSRPGARSIKTMSRCGLGQTSPNPILTTLQNFRELYESRVRPPRRTSSRPSTWTRRSRPPRP